MALIERLNLWFALQCICICIFRYLQHMLKALKIMVTFFILVCLLSQDSYLKVDLQLNICEMLWIHVVNSCWFILPCMDAVYSFLFLLLFKCLQKVWLEKLELGNMFRVWLRVLIKFVKWFTWVPALIHCPKVWYDFLVLIMSTNGCLSFWFSFSILIWSFSLCIWYRQRILRVCQLIS